MARSSPAFAAAPVALNQNSARMHSVFSRSFVGTSIAAPSSARRAYIVRRQDGPSMKIGIVFATTTGHTEEVADMIKARLGDKAADPVAVDDCPPELLASYDAILAGSPTWNTGDEEMRSSTEWDMYLYDELEKVDLTGKAVGVFGCGDSVGYSDYFVDAIEEVYTCFEKRGAKMIGHVSTDGYESFEDSKAERNGKFIGLPIDEDNESDMTEDRVNAWCDQVLKEAGL